MFFIIAAILSALGLYFYIKETQMKEEKDISQTSQQQKPYLTSDQIIFILIICILGLVYLIFKSHSKCSKLQEQVKDLDQQCKEQSKISESSQEEFVILQEKHKDGIAAGVLKFSIALFFLHLSHTLF